VLVFQRTAFARRCGGNDACFVESRQSRAQPHLSAGEETRLSAYGLNQLRYDLRKLKGHGLLECDGTRYAYCLTTKGVQVALLFLFFHKRTCGPIANSCFHHRPNPQHRPESRLEVAYHRADKAILKVVDLLAAG
jgi:hypothetical protein